MPALAARRPAPRARCGAARDGAVRSPDVRRTLLAGRSRFRRSPSRTGRALASGRACWPPGARADRDAENTPSPRSPTAAVARALPIARAWPAVEPGGRRSASAFCGACCPLCGRWLPKLRPVRLDGAAVQGERLGVTTHRDIESSVTMVVEPGPLARRRGGRLLHCVVAGGRDVVPDAPRGRRLHPRLWLLHGVRVACDGADPDCHCSSCGSRRTPLGAPPAARSPRRSGCCGGRRRRAWRRASALRELAAPAARAGPPADGGRRRERSPTRAASSRRPPRSRTAAQRDAVGAAPRRRAARPAADAGALGAQSRGARPPAGRGVARHARGEVGRSGGGGVVAAAVAAAVLCAAVAARVAAGGRAAPKREGRGEAAAFQEEEKLGCVLGRRESRRARRHLKSPEVTAMTWASRRGEDPNHLLSVSHQPALPPMFDGSVDMRPEHLPGSASPTSVSARPCRRRRRRASMEINFFALRLRPLARVGAAAPPAAVLAHRRGRREVPLAARGLLREPGPCLHPRTVSSGRAHPHRSRAAQRGREAALRARHAEQEAAVAAGLRLHLAPDGRLGARHAAAAARPPALVSSPLRRTRLMCACRAVPCRAVC